MMLPSEMDELRQLLIIAGVASSKRREAAACAGKDRFETYEQAKMAIRPQKGLPLHPYHCRDCHKWHIGRNRERQDRLFYQQQRRKP
jgi:hypothetical protein